MAKLIETQLGKAGPGQDDVAVGELVTSPAVMKPQHRPLHDPTVTFEEYLHYARNTRLEESSHPPVGRETTAWSLIFPSKSDAGVAQKVGGEKANSSGPNTHAGVSDEEWTNASRALRTATRGACFYLITTDILGPSSLPYAFATMGWGPGITLYTIFAVLAGYSGYLLYEIFLGLDSYEYPVRSFGDLGYRLYGPWMRYLFNFLQGLQLILLVGLNIIMSGESLSQSTRFQLCFIVCCLICALIGMVAGQVRTLQKLGWLANAAVWINLVWVFITIGAVAHYPPNYRGSGASAGAVIDGGIHITPDADGNYPPVQTSGGLPHSDSFAGSVSGAMQAVFSYGGSMMFPEFMAEMKRPKDFLSAMWAAQAFIYFWYMFHGLFVYGYQGQYSINPSYLGISEYRLQVAANTFAMVAILIAAALYGNIGIKVIYNGILMEWFRAPDLTRRPGKIVFAVLIPIYWAIAYAIAAGIPNFSGLTAVATSICVLQFTYTFPPLLSIAFYIKKHAMVDGDGFDASTGRTIRADSGFSRLRRGLLGRRWYANIGNFFYFLGALALAGLGAYSSIEVLKDAFAKGSTSSYVCKSPLDGM
ncbi:amino acid transporter [Apiospora kogelbergensis]|uniref:Amino acid transporter n=1 Tax=Apiospora kogelbergensis TaxID=1337665 RepID=A0AAW0QHH9_9PEZI